MGPTVRIVALVKCWLMHDALLASAAWLEEAFWVHSVGARWVISVVPMLGGLAVCWEAVVVVVVLLVALVVVPLEPPLVDPAACGKVRRLRIG